jgi:hypothetical protein
VPVQASDFTVGARFPGILADAELKSDGTLGTADILAITGASTAKLEISGVALSWSIVDGQFVTVYPNGAERRYQLLRENLPGDLVMLMATDYNKGLPQRAVTTLASRSDAPQSFTADGGLYKRWYSQINARTDAINGNKFGFEFRADGTGLNLSVNNGVESNQAVTWSINPDGSLRILRSNGRFIREWKLIGRQGANLAVLESQRDTSNSSVTIPWRVVVYTDTSASEGGAPVSPELVADWMTGFWHFGCDGKGRSKVYEVIKAGPARIHFARSLVRDYSSNNCTGTYTEVKASHNTKQDYSDISAVEQLADGRVRFTSSGFMEDGVTALKSTGTLSSYRHELTIDGDSWNFVRRVKDFAFP